MRITRRCLSSTSSVVVVLLIAFTVSYHARPACAGPTAQVSTTSAAAASRAPARELWWFDVIPVDMDAEKEFVMSGMIKVKYTFPSDDIVAYLWKGIRYISWFLTSVMSDPLQRVETCMNWMIESEMNPFNTLTDGMHSFQRLFRYIHRIRKDTSAGLHPDNPVYQCFKSVHPPCVAQASKSIESIVLYQFFCASLFYDKCDLHNWFNKGGWKVPDINGDTCHLHPTPNCH